MELILPELIKNYIASSNAVDTGAFVNCFTENATVLDEGRTLQGRQAIRKWFIRSKKKYEHHMEPVGIEESGDEIILTAKVYGNFEGSPVNLRYRIRTGAGLIRDLRIV